MARIVCNALSKHYDGGPAVLHPLDLDIADGEFIVLLGPSGCGKSTMLRMIAGLEAITGGELVIGDAVVNDLPPRERNVAMVFQNYALYPHMTVYDNIAFGLRRLKLPADEIDRRVREVAQILSLDALLDRRPRAMSGGQQQRTAIARAMIKTPAVFLFDEPLSNLDAKLRTQLRGDIKRLHRRLKTTTLYVTHDQLEAMTLADRVVLMRGGRIEQIGTPAELYGQPHTVFAAGFVGTPAMNFADGTIERAGSSVLLDCNGVRWPLAAPRFAQLQHGRHVKVAIRPNHLRLAADGDARPDALALTGTVELAELLGAEALVTLDWHGRPCAALVPAPMAPAPGTVVALRFDEAALHLFDAGTERNVTLPDANADPVAPATPPAQAAHTVPPAATGWSMSRP
ncbi:sn-glycerol-3-phosphate ABC transporter ATP-binding protein UgpC [Burkholderia multivorans]|uniref:ABC transporter ATP-binding protein n=1 Tax=Burkholderia multivorans TaxID=87883 RepID=UPI00201950BC|nr:sn-glycerol-3-phosphate ABC transporter ATP-binding protein UgpC [Burkholderia multivorans]MCO1372636.1 sn-glycerol-3-phosphate ABC transporter ATP-binding protein UgpC [Burkholderia multivorans]MCO1456107.1 sn-glycerol-3-phosphate ABC transporter ATP-binding protein UgpC [Burkholderia multivorans]MCO1470656.1 sn-glycerol-3-phosphate ABC transporter ATP-binding protein UgpC [Burkholderia multivorans]UQO19721.1 sn-glycerol-3-phosphate ABC transporter ATP-binding protein UgpC [Burkholderia mul